MLWELWEKEYLNRKNITNHHQNICNVYSIKTTIVASKAVSCFVTRHIIYVNLSRGLNVGFPLNIQPHDLYHTQIWTFVYNKYQIWFISVCWVSGRWDGRWHIWSRTKVNVHLTFRPEINWFSLNIVVLRASYVLVLRLSMFSAASFRSQSMKYQYKSCRVCTNVYLKSETVLFRSI